MGGEPTFVSIDNQVDPEWTTDADGPHKRERASELAARLKKVWAPQGLVQRSQGKWYPGEPLPRWQIGLYWRTDGEPLWTDDALLADPWADRTPSRSTADAPTPGRQVLGAVADGLGLPAAQVRPAYEDALGRLAAAVRQPDGRTGRGRRTIWRTTPPTPAPRCWPGSTSPSPSPRAYVLPLHRRDDELRAGPAPTGGCAAAASCCSTGDSPAGLRLPLDSISWQPPRPSLRQPIRWPPSGALPTADDRADAAVVEDADDAPDAPRWSPRSATACSTSSCRRPRSSSTSST